MRINLLKNRRVLSERDYLRERRLLTGAVVAVVVLVVMTTAMAIWNVVLTSRLSSIEETITKANVSLQGLATANAEQLYVKNRLDLIGNFLDEQAVARESLQQVLVLSVPGVRIGGLAFVAQNEIEIAVIADSVTSLKEVIGFYEQAEGYFPQVVSQGVSRNKEGEYELKLVLTLPVPTEEKS